MKQDTNHTPAPQGRSTPTLIIGDVHGNVPFLEQVQATYPQHHKIFVGDFVDSRQFTRADELKGLDIVIGMIERGEAEACLGNHEWSYLNTLMRCSGYDESFDMELRPYKEKLLRLFKYFVWFPEHNVLITHAGLTFQLWKELGLTLGKLAETLDGWARQPVTETPAGRIGLSRGGIDPVGGIFWCDWYSEFQPVPRLTQIFGHTSALTIQEEMQEPPAGIRRRGSNYNIDCLARTWEMLELGVNGELRTLSMEKPSQRAQEVSSATPGAPPSRNASDPSNPADPSRESEPGT
jgi:hypothetical protein